MLGRADFILKYLILALIQMLLCNYANFSPYLTLSILPVMVLCIPTRANTTWAMLIAFVTALAIDFLAGGVIGLNALALVPVALIRRPVCDSIFDKELAVRGDDFSIRKYGMPKVVFAIFLVQTLFLLIYVTADGGVQRPFSFSLVRFALSLVAGVLLSIPAAAVLTPDDRV